MRALLACVAAVLFTAAPFADAAGLPSGPCQPGGPNDVLFAIDVSISVAVTPGVFNSQVQFIQGIASEVASRDSEARFALFSFSTNQFFGIGFVDIDEFTDFLDEADTNIVQEFQQTWFDPALQFAINMAAQSRPAVNDKLVFLSDAALTQVPVTPATQVAAEAAFTAIVAIGILQGIASTDLQNLAHTDAMNFFSAPTLADLDAIADKIVIAVMDDCMTNNPCNIAFCDANDICQEIPDLTKVGTLDCCKRCACAACDFDYQCITGTCVKPFDNTSTGKCAAMPGETCEPCPGNLGVFWDCSCFTECKFCRDCAPGYYCDNGACVERLDPCSPCDDWNSQCKSNLCVGGKCAIDIGTPCP